LGAPNLDTARQVAIALADFPRRSVALGELADLDEENALQLAQLFPVVKLGLSCMARPMQNGSKRWQDRLNELASRFPAHLVPVIYADWQAAAAPKPEEVLDWAGQWGSQWMLIDTYVKNGQGLLKHISADGLRALIEYAGSRNIQIVLAGSLGLTSLSLLKHLPCGAIGIRGAACRGDRTGCLDRELIQEWVGRMNETGVCAPSLVQESFH
jgi:hypothetical protein